MIVALRTPSLAKFGEVDTVPVSDDVTTQEWLDIDSYYMYGDTQNTGATRSQCSLDISTFRVSYKAMTVSLSMSLDDIICAMYLIGTSSENYFASSDIPGFFLAPKIELPIRTWVLPISI